MVARPGAVTMRASLAFLVVVMVLLPVAQASEAVRRLPETARCNDSILVPVEVRLDNGTRSWGIDEEVPNGWKVVLPTQGGSTRDPGHVKWFRFGTQPLNGTVVYYHIVVPDFVSGNFTVKGTFQTDQQSTEAAVGGNGAITVTCDRTKPSSKDAPFYLSPWLLWPLGLVALLLVVLLARRVLRD